MLVTQYAAKTILFSAIKNQALSSTASPPDVLVWRKYRTLSCSALNDIPYHVLLTSAGRTKGGDIRQIHFALVCNSPQPLKVGGNAFRFANPHYKNLSKSGQLGKSNRGQRTTTALVKWTTRRITDAECDNTIDFVADFASPYCVQLSHPKQIQHTAISAFTQQIGNGLSISQWRSAVAGIRL